MSATHNGTCQVCGRLQALPNGVLSKHGYVVKGYGYFVGTCPGAERKPLEIERTFADFVAADVMKDSKNATANAKKVAAGKLLPKQAKNGKSEVTERINRWGGKSRSWTDVLVPYAEAPEHYQREARESLQYSFERHAKLAADTSKDITERANRVHGKPLTPRATEEKKEIKAGTVIRIGGKSGYDATVLRIESRMCRGCGPFLNGQVLPHVVFERNGKEYAVPSRTVRRSAIVG